MSEVSRERNAEYQRAWYSRNRERKLELVKNRMDLLREFAREVKEANPCFYCGETDPNCLEFHHLDPNEKEDRIQKLITRGASRERVKAELLKCSVICANCHRKLHYSNALGFQVSVNRGGKDVDTHTPRLKLPA